MAELDLRARPRDWADPIETASVDELRALQLERLNAAISHAVRVPHYRRMFAAAGINPGDVKSLDDLAKPPFTTKEDLRQNYPFGMFAVPMSEIVRIHASSGTTGKLKVVGYTRGNQRAMRRIERIRGRSDDMLIIRGDRLDELEVIVETRDALPPHAMMALADRGVHLIKAHIGVTTTVRTVAPGTIVRSQAKAKRVIDKRPRN